MRTPIQKIEVENIYNKIYIKRDDLLPFSFGGNKARIAEEYFADMNAQGKDCIIGYGNARSNLCRVLSNMSASKGKQCYIVSSADEDERRVETNNSLISKVCNAKIIYCTKKNVAESVENVLKECEAKGLNPYYIYGDKYGNGNETVPVNAYKKVYKEIKEQEIEMGLSFDYIFLAIGTGMTQAGMIVGKHELLGKEKIIGISVAREKESALKYLANYVKSHIGKFAENEDLCVVDDYICGGYGKFDARIMQCIKTTLTQTGIALDPTYTGKAFYGMQEYLKKENIIGKNILFIHTGGTPLFFDLLSSDELKDMQIVKLEYSKDNEKRLCEFLKEQSNQFAVPLFENTNLDNYSNKILSKGYVFAAMSESEIKGVICGYANDFDTNNAFESLFVVATEMRGTGIAKLLFERQVQYCKSQGMKTLTFTTNEKNYAARKFYEKMNVPIVEENKKHSLIAYKLELK